MTRHSNYSRSAPPKRLLYPSNFQQRKNCSTESHPLSFSSCFRCLLASTRYLLDISVYPSPEPASACGDSIVSVIVCYHLLSFLSDWSNPLRNPLPWPNISRLFSKSCNVKFLVTHAATRYSISQVRSSVRAVSWTGPGFTSRPTHDAQQRLGEPQPLRNVLPCATASQFVCSESINTLDDAEAVARRTTTALWPVVQPRTWAVGQRCRPTRPR